MIFFLNQPILAEEDFCGKEIRILAEEDFFGKSAMAAVRRVAAVVENCHESV